MAQCEERLGYFPITSVHRADIRGLFPEVPARKVTAITDQQMEYIARKLADLFLESGYYWEGLRQYAGDILSAMPDDRDTRNRCTRSVLRTRARTHRVI